MVDMTWKVEHGRDPMRVEGDEKRSEYHWTTWSRRDVLGILFSNKWFMEIANDTVIWSISWYGTLSDMANMNDCA